MTNGEDKAQAARPRARSRHKFEQKRDEILSAATEFMNAQGAKGTTLLEVARAVDLNTTSITYYFRRKELLVAAVFERSMDQLHAMVREAAAEPDPQSRVRRFITLHVARRADVIRNRAEPLASLSDLRTLEDGIRLPLEKRYQKIFRDVRDFFDPAETAWGKEVRTARAHMLLETVFWLPIWISQYPIDEFPRVSRRLYDILEKGVALDGAEWAPRPIAIDGEESGEGGTENFMRVATRLINQIGYRGASVLRIVEELKVTKGSFYHHLDAKDDLIFASFRRSYRRIAQVQLAANAAGGSQWVRLSSTMAALLDIQFDASWPLTRTTALQALPPALRIEAVERSNRTAIRFAGTLVEGASEGSLRLVDPMIASQAIIAALNSAFDLRIWAARLSRSDAIGIYASTVLRGLFAEDPGTGWPQGGR